MEKILSGSGSHALLRSGFTASVEKAAHSQSVESTEKVIPSLTSGSGLSIDPTTARALPSLGFSSLEELERVLALEKALPRGDPVIAYSSLDLLQDLCARPALCAELSRKVRTDSLEIIEEAARTFDKKAEDTMLVTSNEAMVCMRDQLALIGFNPRDRLVALVFLRHVLSHPMKIASGGTSTQINMRAAFEGPDKSRAKLWPDKSELLNGRISALSRHGMHIRLVHAISSLASDVSRDGLVSIPHEVMASLVDLPIHLFLGEGTTLAICARVFAEKVEDQTSESFATATSALSTSGFSKESISPLDVTTTLLLPDMVRGNSKCELQRDNERHVEWSECQPKLEFVKIASNGSHLEVSTSITYDASIGTEEAPKLRRGSRVRKQFVHRFQLEQSRVNSEHMSADSVVFALMTSLSDLSITQEEIQAEISAGFIEGDSIGFQDSGVSWHPSSDGHSSLSP